MSEKPYIDERITSRAFYNALQEFCENEAAYHADANPELAAKFDAAAQFFSKCPMTLEDRIDHMMREEGHAEVRNIANRLHLRHALRAKESDNQMDELSDCPVREGKGTLS